MAKLMQFVVWRWRGDQPGTYRFKIGGCAPGEFEKVLAEVKSIPLRYREWNPAEKVWEVAAVPEVERILSQTFENGGQCIEIVRAQMRLF